MRVYGEKTMIPQFPNFKPLEIGQRAEIAEHLAATPRDICELGVGNLFIWQDFDRPQATIINDNVCVTINPPNEKPYFLEPFGARKLKETVDICLGHTGRISRASEVFVALLPEKVFKINPLRDHFDYIYGTKAMAELKGRQFDGKRNHVKKFRERHPDYEYLPLGNALKKEALELFEKWFVIREESRYFPKLAHTAQRGGLETAFKYYKELGLFGGALVVGGKLSGFTMGSAIRADLVSVHFAYGDPSLQGVSQTLFWEAFNKTYNDFKYADLEQDLGIPGLRKMKLSYQPLKLEKKYEITAA
jgi:hypothetical protein